MDLASEVLVTVRARRHPPSLQTSPVFFPPLTLYSQFYKGVLNGRGCISR